MTIALVQKTATAFSASQTFSSPNAAGNLLIATLGGGAPAGTVSFSDTLGNVWIVAKQQLNNPGFQISSSTIAYCLGCKAGTPTVTAANGPSSPLLALVEYSGVGSFDNAVGGGGNNGTPQVSITMAKPNSLVLVSAFRGAGGATYTPTSGITLEITNANSYQTGDGLFAGTNTVGFSFSSSVWAAAAIAFNPRIPNSNRSLVGAGA